MKRVWPKPGGYRENAGRKSFYGEPMISTTLTLTEADVDFLDQFGKGSKSRAVRWLISDKLFGSHKGVK